MHTEIKTTASAVASHIERMILTDCLSPNSRIPSERQLSSRLGVSRAVIREALRELHGRGIIETHQGKGSFVNCLIDSSTRSEPIDHLLEIDDNALYDLLEVREQLEAHAAYLAAKRATRGDKYRITQAFDLLNASEWDARLDHNFHQTILDACHNPVLVHTLASLKRLTLKSVEAAVDNLNHRPSFRQQIEKHHRQIFNAVTSGQADWARRAAAFHVHYVNEALNQLQENPKKLSVASE